MDRHELKQYALNFLAHKATHNQYAHYTNVANHFIFGIDDNYLVALFHDAIMDGHVTIDELWTTFQFTDAQIEAIGYLTQGRDETDYTYVNMIKQNKIAKDIKLVCLADNMKWCVSCRPVLMGFLKASVELYEMLAED